MDDADIIVADSNGSVVWISPHFFFFVCFGLLLLLLLFFHLRLLSVTRYHFILFCVAWLAIHSPQKNLLLFFYICFFFLWPFRPNPSTSTLQHAHVVFARCRCSCNRSWIFLLFISFFLCFFLFFPGLLLC